MKKIFISYSDDNMRYSLKRIGKQAKRIGGFDEIILYTPDMMPAYIKEFPLMAYERGGGYWVWKPAIIWETLQKCDEGDIVVYADAGCSLKKSERWEEYWNSLSDNHHTIVFQFKDEMPEWKRWGQTSTKIRYWTKISAFRYFEKIVGDYGDFNKIMGGFIICKGKNNLLIKNWLDITLSHPELIMDLSDEEKKDQIAGFAYHKHDQSMITPLAYLYAAEVLILPETSETEPENAAVVASRIRAKTRKDYIALRLKYYTRNLLGNKLFDWIKHKIKRMRS
jgi:hypothetical protein